MEKQRKQDLSNCKDNPDEVHFDLSKNYCLQNPMTENADSLSEREVKSDTPSDFEQSAIEYEPFVNSLVEENAFKIVDSGENKDVSNERRAVDDSLNAFVENLLDTYNDIKHQEHATSQAHGVVKGDPWMGIPPNLVIPTPSDCQSPPVLPSPLDLSKTSSIASRKQFSRIVKERSPTKNSQPTTKTTSSSSLDVRKKRLHKEQHNYVRSPLKEVGQTTISPRKFRRVDSSDSGSSSGSLGPWTLEAISYQLQIPDITQPDWTSHKEYRNEVKSISAESDVFAALGYKRGVRLGKGLSGEVYLVTRSPNTIKERFKNAFIKKSAIKLLSREDHNLDIRNRAYFNREVGIMSQIDFPFLMCNFEAVETPSHFAIIMPYCPHGDLYSRLSNLEIKDMKRYFYMVSLAIDYLHDKRIVHRDIKCKNILINERNQAILSDYGLSYNVCDKNALHKPDGAGTTRYMPPEAQGRKPFNVFKADMYALGVVLLAMAKKEEPQVPDLDQINETDVHNVYRFFMRNLLEPNPECRWNSTFLQVQIAKVKRYYFDNA